MSSYIENMIPPSIQSMMKNIFNSVIIDPKLVLAFSLGYFIDQILKKIFKMTHKSPSVYENEDNDEDTEDDAHDDNNHANKNKKYSMSDDELDYYNSEFDCDNYYETLERLYLRDEYDTHESYKMVLVINAKLNMGKGKVAAQCAHAAIAAYKIGLKVGQKFVRHWERAGQTKITVKAKDDNELMDILQKAVMAGLIVDITHDAGRTQIEAGSKTVCVIGPGPSSVIDKITGKLKLY